MQQAAPAFTFFSNRGSRQFAAALEPLGGRCFDASLDAAPDLLYFDTYTANTHSADTRQASSDDQAQLPPPLHARSLTLIPRERTAALDNKASMARALMAEGLSEPRVYFRVQDVPTDAASLWFVKTPHRSGGRGIAVVRSADLGRFQGQGVIIQEAVQDLDLIAGHKYTLRLYVLAFRGQLYLYADGFAVVHGAPYQPGSCDPAVQFVHDGYLRADSAVRLLPLSELDQTNARLQGCAATLSQTFAVFRDRLKHEREFDYCLFGVDMLIRSDGRAVLVEINDRPNLVHTPLINRKVNIPMLRAMVLQLSPEWGSAQQDPQQSFQQLLSL